MKKVLLTLFGGLLVCNLIAQTTFLEDLEIPAGFAPPTVLMPPSPLNAQVLFVGGVDWVETTKTYGNEAGRAYAKEWHDFIGFTADETGGSLGWVSINHEAIYHDDRIGDGGGMTVFRVSRDPLSDQLVVMEQTLEDGRKGQFFNVDFANTVGETGMNCGGIVSTVDGRIWTAEEWFRGNNASINNGSYSGPDSNGAFPKAPGTPANQGVRDTAEFTVTSDIAGDFDGQTIAKYENFNYMVEIDPRQAVAIRKQYNWGRQGFEGGVVMPDNKTVYLGVDATPAFWLKFEAENAGDFTSGKLYVYKHDGTEKWIELDNSDFDGAFSIDAQAVAAGASMFNRVEWVAYDPQGGMVYFTETGRDNPGGAWAGEYDAGAVFPTHHVARATDQGTTPETGDYADYYGRVMAFNPTTDELSVQIEGGPYFENSPDEASYPDKHLSNPDGLTVMEIDGQSFLVICEDLNGNSFGRTPAGVGNRLCEMFLLDLSIETPGVDDLIRISAVPAGAEVTGAVATPDGKSLLVNSQHPSSSNPFPFNHSLTYAINGFNNLTVTGLDDPNWDNSSALQIYPNPTTRRVFLNQTTDVAIYDLNGRRLNVYRNISEIDVSHLPAATYFLQTASGEVRKLVIQ